MDDIGGWEILDSSYVFSTKWFKIRKDTVKLPCGTIVQDYYVKERSDWAAIFCMTSNLDVLLTKTYKHGSRSLIYELPSGSIDENESPKEAIIRELREETGYCAVDANIQKIGIMRVDPTYTQANQHLYLASDVTKVFEPENNPVEKRIIQLIPHTDILKFVWDHLEMFPESQVANIHLAVSYLNRRDSFLSHESGSGKTG